MGASSVGEGIGVSKEGMGIEAGAGLKKFWRCLIWVLSGAFSNSMILEWKDGRGTGAWTGGVEMGASSVGEGIGVSKEGMGIEAGAGLKKFWRCLIWVLPGAFSNSMILESIGDAWCYCKSAISAAKNTK